MTRVSLIGDVHGDVARLTAMLDIVEAETDRMVVLLGDYVNWGPDPAGVLELLSRRQVRLGKVTGSCPPLHRLGFRRWLPGLDSNQEIRLQRPLCYHYTTGQTETALENGVLDTRFPCSITSLPSPLASTCSVRTRHALFSPRARRPSPLQTNRTPSRRYRSSTRPPRRIRALCF